MRGIYWTIQNYFDGYRFFLILNGEGGDCVYFGDIGTEYTVIEMFWYEENKDLFKSEIDAMDRFWPESQYGFFEDGRMYWKVKIFPNVGEVKKEWIILAVYGDGYPAKESFRLYPLSPNYDEILQRVMMSDINTKFVPCLSKDNIGVICFDIKKFSGIFVESIVPCIACVAKWISLFELGINDPGIWELFCEKYA